MTVRTLTAAVLIAAGPFAATAAAESPKEKAARLLGDADRAKVVVLFAHFGADYAGHKLTGSGKVTANGREKPGHFYLEYKYDWKVAGERGTTTLSFFFDPNGVLNHIQVDKTDAVLNQPFLLANVGIKVLGEAVYDGLKDKLSDGDRRLLRRLVDDANAKGLLQFGLAIDLATSK